MRSIRARRTTWRSACSAASIGSTRARASPRRAAGDSPSRARAAVRAPPRSIIGAARIALWWATAAAIVLVAAISFVLVAPNGFAEWFPVQATTGRPATRSVAAADAAAGAVADRSIRGARAIAVCQRQAARRAARARSRSGRVTRCGPTPSAFARDIQRELLAVAGAEASSASSIAAPLSPPQRMKCPKCGYLGFETTDRCRNCQYDFSLTPFSSDPELTLHGAEHKRESQSDFELPPMSRQGDIAQRHRARPRSPVRRSGAGEDLRHRQRPSLRRVERRRRADRETE